MSRVEAGMVAAAAGTKDRKFYETDHAMNLPEIREDRDAWLLKELVPEPPKPEPPKPGEKKD